MPECGQLALLVLMSRLQVSNCTATAAKKEQEVSTIVVHYVLCTQQSKTSSLVSVCSMSVWWQAATANHAVQRAAHNIHELEQQVP